MDVFEPVLTIEDFRTLDEGEILDGYMDGSVGAPCRAGCSRAYAHGWRNGMVDSDRMPPDRAHATLEDAFMARRWVH